MSIPPWAILAALQNGAPTPPPSGIAPPVPGLPPWRQKLRAFGDRALGGIGGVPPGLSPEEQALVARQRNTAIGASLLRSAAPRVAGTGNLLGDIGTAISAGQESSGDAFDRMMRARLMNAQMANAGREIVPAGASIFQNGQNVFTAPQREYAPKSLQHVTRDLGNAIQEGEHDPATGVTKWGETVPKQLTPEQQLNLGLGPDGKPTEDEDALVKQIGEYRMVPSARLQATPKGQRILAAVEKQYPGYDVTTAQAKVNAAKAFGPGGKEGSLLRSIGTANKHLNMLGQMVDELDNGNIQALNRLGNAWTAETGEPAVTNFNSAKEIVGQEVVKAIVANGGGVLEREEAQRKLDAANSPAQLRGVIKTYRTIMDAQHESLLQQRRAAGLPDSTMPDYTEGGDVPTFATEQEAEAAARSGKLKAGTKIKIGNTPGTWQ